MAHSLATLQATRRCKKHYLSRWSASFQSQRMKRAMEHLRNLRRAKWRKWRCPAPLRKILEVKLWSKYDPLARREESEESLEENESGDEMEVDGKEDLQNLQIPYTLLQRLAKKYGVAANQKVQAPCGQYYSCTLIGHLLARKKTCAQISERYGKGRSQIVQRKGHAK